jgi:hypothetical protein
MLTESEQGIVTPWSLDEVGAKLQVELRRRSPSRSLQDSPQSGYSFKICLYSFVALLFAFVLSVCVGRSPAGISFNFLACHSTRKFSSFF